MYIYINMILRSRLVNKLFAKIYPSNSGRSALISKILKNQTTEPLVVYYIAELVAYNNTKLVDTGSCWAKGYFNTIINSEFTRARIYVFNF